MKRRSIQICSGLLAVAFVLGLYQLSEWERERRHARRPDLVVNELLRLAHVQADDRIYDLECGDGAVVVTAAARYGAHGWCFDIYPQRLAEAQARARGAGVEHLIAFHEQFWDSVDVRPASVVVLWLTNPTGHIANYKVRGQLTRELRPGARIVAYWRDLGDWAPTVTTSVPAIGSYPASAVKLWIADGQFRPWLE